MLDDDTHLTAEYLNEAINTASVVSWWYLNNTDADTTHAALYQ
jgi:hypothetical protein